jgi:urea transporter
MFCFTTLLFFVSNTTKKSKIVALKVFLSLDLSHLVLEWLRTWLIIIVYVPFIDTLECLLQEYMDDYIIHQQMV